MIRALDPYRRSVGRIAATLLVLLMGVITPLYGFCGDEATCGSEEEMAHCKESHEATESSDHHRSETASIDAHENESDFPDESSHHHCPPGCWCCGAMLDVPSRQAPTSATLRSLPLTAPTIDEPWFVDLRRSLPPPRLPIC